MKRSLISILLLLSLYGFSFSQIIIDKGIYKVDFSNSLHQPRYVSYVLYKGGGDCDRKENPFHFICDIDSVKCATDKDYEHSGYEKGHMANAEDFAFDCTKDELTFRYYNCLPQTQNLNRGIWKTKETLIRKWSQTDKLYIICGGYFGNKKIGNASVPSYCWKVVQSVSTKKVLFCGWFKNSSKATLEEITISQLEKKLKHKIILVK